MADKVVHPILVLLSKLGSSKQEIASKTATSHIRNPLCVMLRETTVQITNIKE